MGFILDISSHILVKHGMLDQPLRTDYNCLIHLIADHYTLNDSLITAFPHIFWTSLSLSTVLIRAILFRTELIMAGDSN